MLVEKNLYSWGKIGEHLRIKISRRNFTQSPFQWLHVIFFKWFKNGSPCHHVQVMIKSLLMKRDTSLEKVVTYIWVVLNTLLSLPCYTHLHSHIHHAHTHLFIFFTLWNNFFSHIRAAVTGTELHIIVLCDLAIIVSSW